jgi:hypothetical protein
MCVSAAPPQHVCVYIPVGQQWFYDFLGRLHPYHTPARCLTVPSSNTTNGQVLTVSDCTTDTSQRWTPSTASFFPAAFRPVNQRLRSLLATTAQCIENLAFNVTNGAPVAMMGCNNDAATNTNQRWNYTETGQLTLMFNSQKCMEADSSEWQPLHACCARCTGPKPCTASCARSLSNLQLTSHRICRHFHTALAR